MTNKRSAAVIFTPGPNHVQHLPKVVESIRYRDAHNITIGILAETGAIAEKVSCVDVKRVVESDDLRLYDQIYVQEGRADIGAFVYSQLDVAKYFSEYEKIIFMEVDQIVRTSISELINFIFKNDVKIGCVQATNTITLKPLLPPKRFRQYINEDRYFNTGVMVIDTAYWNSLKLREKCFECAEIQKNSGGTYYDYYAQGALNYAIAKKIQKIPFKFNFTQLGWNPHIPTNHIAKACILHWSGPRKPWNENGLYKDWYQTA